MIKQGIDNLNKMLGRYIYVFVVIWLILIGSYAIIEISGMKDTIELNKVNQEQNASKLTEQNREQLIKIAKLEKLVKIQETKNPKMERLLKDLDRCKSPEIAFSIGYSESHLVYGRNHPTEDLRGIGGIKPKDWGSLLAKKRISIDSLQGIDCVYQTMLVENHNNHTKALKYYKGTAKNNYSYRLTSAYLNRIKTSKDFKYLVSVYRQQKLLKRELGLA
jgi:hypothetical protein